MQMKAVFHIDEMDKWKLLIGNIQNLSKALTDKPYEVEIVANSVAVKEYIKVNSEFSKELMELSQTGIKICACKNALNNLMIKNEDIFDFVEIVPVGVKEIIDKQLIGFAYIKP